MIIKPKFAQAYMDVADRFSDLSHARRLKVGAIIVKEDRIISIGYNGMPSGWDNSCEEVDMPDWAHPDDVHVYGIMKTKPEVLHAEANAILKVAQSTESTVGASMFCTHTPCIECAKLIYQSGISRVYVRYEYEASKGCGEEFLKQSGIPIEYVPPVD